MPGIYSSLVKLNVADGESFVIRFTGGIISSLQQKNKIMNRQTFTLFNFDVFPSHEWGAVSKWILIWQYNAKFKNVML